ncbi:MAG: tetratricopeptide repeat protein [Muribaculaceae bacterium]|nr:tetratricopeptide repeat protein [Muribaculaceae bacterium]
MKHFLIALLAMGFAATVHAQVINSINDENMRRGFDKAIRQEKAEKKKERKPELTVEVDTTTRYFALIDSAQTMLDAKDWAGAEVYIKKALESDPANPNNSLLLSNLGTVQRYQGKNDEAIKNYTMALDMTPNAVTLLRNRAVLLIAVGRTEEARADYERILTIEPLDIEALYNRGLIKLDGGDATGARDDFEKILRIKANSGLGHQGLATLHKVQGNFEKAISHYNDAIKEGATAQLLANRADCHLALRHLSDASEDIASALQLDAEDPFLYVLRAKLNKMRYNFDDMNRDIELAEKYGINKADVKRLLEVQ